MPRLSERTGSALARPAPPLEQPQQPQQRKEDVPIPAARAKPVIVQPVVALRSIRVPPPPDHAFLKARQRWVGSLADSASNRGRNCMRHTHHHLRS